MNIRVIVATLGNRPSLRETLVSINDQKIEGLEVKIVVPDDQILNVMKLAEEVGLSNYQLIQDPGKGFSAAINQGFAAKGDFNYFCWINDDDKLAEGSLNRSVNILEKDPDSQAVVGSLGYLLGNKSRRITNRVSKLTFITSKIGPNIIPQPGSLIRRSVIKNDVPLNENYKYAMDLDLWLKILNLGKIRTIKEIQAFMHWHAGSITISNRSEATSEAFQIRYRNAQTISLKILIIVFYIPTKILSSLLSKIN
jgi:glycosyltransferase involved in cell wall biosynthesis